MSEENVIGTEEIVEDTEVVEEEVVEETETE
jgi:hypothetical protein